MKCVVEDKIQNKTVVFETNKITYMKKKDWIYATFKNEYAIYISFDNGREEDFKFRDAQTRDNEFERIMKCWRSNEPNPNQPLTGD